MSNKYFNLNIPPMTHKERLEALREFMREDPLRIDYWDFDVPDTPGGLAGGLALAEMALYNFMKEELLTDPTRTKLLLEGNKCTLYTPFWEYFIIPPHDNWDRDAYRLYIKYIDKSGLEWKLKEGTDIEIKPYCVYCGSELSTEHVCNFMRKTRNDLLKAMKRDEE